MAMDIKEFSDPLFDAQAWVNKTLKTSTKDTAVTSLTSKLEMCFQQLNGELDGSCQNVMQNLPRVLHDIENLAGEASILKEKMNAVKREISKAEESTEKSISSLEKIDNIKMQLANAKQALYEADNWTVLSTDIEAAFENSDIDLIASKLVSMAHSLRVLSSAIDYENKKMQLEGLKNRLEAMVSPYVVEAFTNMSTDQSKRFVKIFQDIGRLPLLVKYYSKCQKASLIQRWHSLVDLSNEDCVVECLQAYYELLLTNWQEQMKWFEDVIPQMKATDVLLELYTDLLVSIGPALSKAFEENLKQTSEPLSVLLELKQCSKNFGNNLHLKLLNSGVTGNQEQKLAQAVYVPFVQLISKYGTLQSEWFQLQLSALIKNDALTDIIQTLGQKNSQIYAIAQEGQKMCLELTEGCGYTGFLAALESLFNNYFKLYQTVAVGIRDEKTGESDLNVFQMCITVLQNLGEFMAKLKQVDMECVQAIISSGNSLNKTQLEPFSAFPLLVVTPEKKRELDELVTTLTEANEPIALKSCAAALESVCRNIYQTTFQVIFSPISVLLESFPSAPAWKSRSLSSDLPDYGFVPQEYITQIGQYLMNLPQLLEPFLAMDSPSLNLSLSVVGVEYTQLVSENQGNGVSFAEIFLGSITEATCRAYSEHILALNSLGGSACKQLVTDINYLGNVLEDLGFSLSQRLKHIVVLVKLSPADYSAQCTGCSPQLVAAVRQMRNIITE